MLQLMEIRVTGQDSIVGSPRGPFIAGFQDVLAKIGWSRRVFRTGD
jgi:hypothetical protein